MRTYSIPNEWKYNKNCIQRTSFDNAVGLNKVEVDPSNKEVKPKTTDMTDALVGVLTDLYIATSASEKK